MTFKITNYTGEVKGLSRGGAGRAPSALTLALQDAIAASAADGKSRKWEGAASDYKKNAQKVRIIGNNHRTPVAPFGYSMNVGLDGQDLTFSATPFTENKEGKNGKAKAEPTPAPPTPTKMPAKKVPAKKATAASK